MRTAKPVRAAALALPVAVALACTVLARQAPGTDGAPKAKGGEYNLSGPYTHDNLSIFLVHGEDRLKGKPFLLLSEALEQKKFVINETQSVNQLTMENLSPTEEVLILSGDILKGGQQDRIAQFDQVVPPKSGKLPLAAFCVEHTASRWMRPLKGKDLNFDGNPGLSVSNSARLSNRLYMDQGKVWMEVRNTQKKLSDNLKAEVKAKESDSSLALSLEVKEVRAATERFVAKFAALPEGKKDAIGFAFAINGKMVAADVYGSGALFRKIWPRLLKATAIEAVAEKEKDKKFAPAGEAAVRAFLDDAAKGKASSRDLGKGLRQVTNESSRNVLFETQDLRNDGSWIRRNYLAK